MHGSWIHLTSWTAVKGSDGDPECIFFTLDTYQKTFICDFWDPTAETGVRFRTHEQKRNRNGTDGQTDGTVEIVI